MKLLVIDGNSIINRAFYGIRLLSNKKGVYTNAVTGFMNIYLKLIEAYKPDGAAAAFDLKAPTFRHKMYDGYKAGRRPMPEELAMQMPLVKDILRAMGVKVVECEGFEADDILGTLSRAVSEAGGECILATGDRDSFQLITDRIYVNLASNKEDILFTPDKIREVYGVEPVEMLEVKALMGDPSDNIPGVPGIGEKTALSLIQKYHSTERIYADTEALEVSKGVKEKLVKGRESAELSRKLGMICLEAPIDTDPTHYLYGERDEAKLASILTELEMFSVLKKLKISAGAIDAASAEAAAREKEDTAVRADIPELDGSVPDYWLDPEGKLWKFVNGGVSEAAAAELSDGSPKRTADMKAMMTALNCEINGVVFDSALAAYLLEPDAADYSPERLCAAYKVPYGEGGAKAVHELNRVLNAELCAQGMDRLLRDIEIPLAGVLVDMERQGIAVDREALVSFGKRLSDEADEL